MIIQRTATGLQIAAPAKINLFLNVVRRRSDGYHEVQTLLCPISLFDQLCFVPTQQSDIEFRLILPETTADRACGTTLPRSHLTGDPAWDIPADSSNLVVRAVRRVQQALGTTRGCRIELRKVIPAAAGLGGGSSDTAAAIVASLVSWHGWNRSLAVQIASEIGSDVPFFLGSTNGIGLALATGRGESCQTLAAQPKLDVLVTHPPVGCSTREVYRNCAVYGKNQSFQEIVDACQTGQLKKIGAQLVNTLQLPAADLTDWIDRQLRLFADIGVKYSLMSGSGSSCFALVDGPQYADRLLRAAPARGIERIYAVQAWYGKSIEQQLADLEKPADLD